MSKLENLSRNQGSEALTLLFNTAELTTAMKGSAVSKVDHMMASSATAIDSDSYSDLTNIPCWDTLLYMTH